MKVIEIPKPHEICIVHIPYMVQWSPKEANWERGRGFQFSFGFKGMCQAKLNSNSICKFAIFDK